MGDRLEVIEGMEAEGFGAGCNRGFEHLAQRGWQGLGMAAQPRHPPPHRQ